MAHFLGFFFSCFFFFLFRHFKCYSIPYEIPFPFVVFWVFICDVELSLLCS
jgi:hypothetical protein